MDFYARMHIVLMAIPTGCVATYGQIAMLCGQPKNSRQVGYGLRHGLAGKNVPAHRVVNAQGFLTGARSFEFPDLQKNLLEAEGVTVIRTEKGWRVDVGKFGWKNTMEDAMALMCKFEE